MTKLDQDTNYEDETITNVEVERGGWGIGTTGGGFHVPDKGVEPKIGQTARFYYKGPGKGLGCTVRGLFIDGRRVFYKTEAQQVVVNRRRSEAYARKKQRSFAKNRALYDAQYSSLPEVFRARLDGFRERKPQFRVEFEPYELMVCADAVKIAALVPDGADPVESVRAFKALDWSEHVKAGIDEEHSGNSFGAACHLAVVYLTSPNDVPKTHGAMCALVGCQEYGCWSTTQGGKDAEHQPS